MMVRALLLMLGLAVAGLAAQTWRLQTLRTAVAEEKAAQAEVDRINEKRAQARTQQVDHATQTRIQAARVAADGSRDDADRLRRALVAISQRPATPTSCADDQRTIDRMAQLLAEGAGLVAECQRRGGELAAQVEGLQDLQARPAVD
jgi:CO/xanthine dehydrogenase FAD-binding subunit